MNTFLILTLLIITLLWAVVSVIPVAFISKQGSNVSNIPECKPVCDTCRLQTADYRLHLGLNSTLVSLNSTQVSLNSTQVSLFTVSYW